MTEIDLYAFMARHRLGVLGTIGGGGTPQSALMIYFKAWPDGPTRMNWPGIVYFVVRPQWIRYSDFDQDPPLIREFQFSG